MDEEDKIEKRRLQKREAHKRWREKNPDYDKKRNLDPNVRKRKREASKRFREENPDYARTWEEKNKEKRKAQKFSANERFRENNPDYARRYYEENKVHLYECSKIWKSENSDKVNSYHANRRAKVALAIDPTANHDAIKAIYAQCARLNANLTEGQIPYEVDHCIPISKGGKHHENNLTIMRRDYNRMKSDSDDPMWSKIQDWLLS